MTRGRNRNLLPLNPELEKSLKKSKKTKQVRPNLDIHTSSSSTEPSDSSPRPQNSPVQEQIDNHIIMEGQGNNGNNVRPPVQQANQFAGGQQPVEERSIRELTQADIDHDSYSSNMLRQSGFEMKIGMLNHLPKFYGRAGEDPHEFLTELYERIRVFGAADQDIDEAMLRAFTFSWNAPRSENLH